MRGILQINTENSNSSSSSKQGHGINHSIATSSSANPNDSSVYYDSSSAPTSHSHRGHHHHHQQQQQQQQQSMEPYLQSLLFNGEARDSVNHNMRRSMNFMGEQDRELMEQKPDFAARISSNDSSDLSVLNTNSAAMESMNRITEHRHHHHQQQQQQNHRDSQISPSPSPSPNQSTGTVDPIIRSKIVAHPIYPRLVLAYLNCNKVNQIRKEFHQFL